MSRLRMKNDVAVVFVNPFIERIWDFHFFLGPNAPKARIIEAPKALRSKTLGLF